MDLSRSNSQKKTLINANILINISLIIPYLLHSIPISIPKKNTCLTLSLYIWSKPFVSPLVSLSLYFLNLHFSLSISSSIAPPLPPPQLANRKKNKKQTELFLFVSTLFLFFLSFLLWEHCFFFPGLTLCALCECV